MPHAKFEKRSAQAYVQFINGIHRFRGRQLTAMVSNENAMSTFTLSFDERVLGGMAVEHTLLERSRLTQKEKAKN